MAGPAGAHAAAEFARRVARASRGSGAREGEEAGGFLKLGVPSRMVGLFHGKSH